jgi:hypothetical protein
MRREDAEPSLSELSNIVQPRGFKRSIGAVTKYFIGSGCALWKAGGLRGLGAFPAAPASNCRPSISSGDRTGGKGLIIVCLIQNTGSKWLPKPAQKPIACGPPTRGVSCLMKPLGTNNRPSRRN